MVTPQCSRKDYKPDARLSWRRLFESACWIPRTVVEISGRNKVPLYSMEKITAPAHNSVCVCVITSETNPENAVQCMSLDINVGDERRSLV